MDEIFPVLAGIAVGLVIDSIASPRLRRVALALLSVAFGALAAWVSGELARSPIYVPIDTAQVLGAAGVTWALAAGRGRRLGVSRTPPE